LESKLKNENFLKSFHFLNLVLEENKFDPKFSFALSILKGQMKI